MTQYFREFYTNWLGKADSYIGTSLSDHFDRFITLYVVYNSLYMCIVENFVSTNRISSKDFNDKSAATDYVIQFLKSRYYIDNLISKQDNIININEIIRRILSEEFHIILDWGNPQRHLDLELLKSLNSNNKNKKAKAILSLFYHVRCNMFHAHKSFEDRQQNLLIPINVLLRNTIEIIYSKLDK